MVGQSAELLALVNEREHTGALVVVMLHALTDFMFVFDIVGALRKEWVLWFSEVRPLVKGFKRAVAIEETTTSRGNPLPRRSGANNQLRV